MVVYFIFLATFITFIILISINKFFPKEYKSLESEKLKKIYKYGILSFSILYAIAFLFLGIYDTLLNQGGNVKALIIIGIIFLILALICTIGTYVYFTIERRNYIRFAQNEGENKDANR